MRKGFTLVEIAIVFVVIGLIVGGVLVAGSLTNAARVQSALRQVSQFDVAITDFKTKYSVLPPYNWSRG